MAGKIEIVKFANGKYGLRRQVLWFKFEYLWFKDCMECWSRKSDKSFEERCMVDDIEVVRNRLNIINMTEEVID